MSKFELYTDKAGEFRWRLVATNGQTICDSGEGFSSKQNALDNIERVKTQAADASITEV